MTAGQYTPGRFVWHELMTPDPAASRAFYGGLFGWTFREVPTGRGTYTLIDHAGAERGGMMSLAELGRDGVPAHWMGYVSVPDVDEAASAARAAGGSVVAEPFDIPDIGRLTVIGDPQHAYTTAWRDGKGDPAPPDRPPVGTFCWDQLNTTGVADATAFYRKLYGWTTEAFPGGGDITVFRAGDHQVASVMQAPEGTPAHWLAYIAVENLARSRDRAGELGGKVMVESIPVPGMGTIGVIADDTGAVLGLFESAA